MLQKQFSFLIICALAFGFLSPFKAKAQLNYYPFDSLKIKRNGQSFDLAFQGGMNAPQFGQIDLNFDGKLDLLIFDRAGDKLSTMLNEGGSNEINYQYAPQYIKYFPAPTDQLYTRDYDCDGDMDLILGGSDLRVFQNVSTPTKGLLFRDEGKIQTVYSPDFPNPIASTLNPGQLNYLGIADVDGDGDLDIITEFGAGNQLEYHKNLSIEQTGNCGLIFERRAKCWGDITESNLNSDIFLDSCRWGDFANPEGNFEIDNSQYQEKGRKHGNSSISIFDIDGNGSMDLVLGDDGSKRLTALYNDDSVSTIRTNSHIYKIDNTYPTYSSPVNLPSLPSAYFIDLNNDGLKDMIVAPNTEDFLSPAVGVNNIKYYQNNGAREPFELNNEALFSDQIVDFGEGCFPTFFDYNKDGKEDLVVGNFGYYNDSLLMDVGQLALLLNTGSQQNPEFEIVDTNYLNIPSFRFRSNDTLPSFNLIPSFGDLNGDGKEDLLLGDHNGTLSYFIDTASAGRAEFKLEKAIFQTIDVGTKAAPTLFDVNQDGLLDLVIGNARGLLEYHENLGDSSNPVFNIDIQSILWQYDSIIRIQLEGNAQLSRLEIGQEVQIQGSSKAGNNVIAIISAINQGQNFIDLIHPFNRSNVDDELNSNAVIDYSLKNWGGFDLYTFNFNLEAVPFLYRDKQNEIKMLLGSLNGEVILFDSISNQKGDTFPILDSNYISQYQGGATALAGADLNGDQLIDLVIGNKAGGFGVYFGLNNVGLDETKNPDDEVRFSLYPNPSSGIFNLGIEDSELNPIRIEIRDVNGRLIEGHNGKKRQFDLSGLPNGIYLFSLIEANRISTRKVILRE